jgi:phage-related baseplate assembly protein
MSLPRPDFVSRDAETITAELVAQYESLTGRTLYPAQVERILIDLVAYRELLCRIAIQEAAEQNLVAFARAPMIDYLGELVDVTRLPAKAAQTTLRITLAAAQPADTLVAAGTRVESSDGLFAFATDVAATIPAGQLTTDVAATCTTAGTTGNGWTAGQLAALTDDPGNGLLTVSNVIASNGGMDSEDDDRLRERIKLAPEAFSTAGSAQAYRFHALSASQAVLDVAVLSVTPGTVQLYPLATTGLPDANLLLLVEATCSAEKVRPLSDAVQALAPTQVDYAISASLTLYAWADAPSAQADALSAAQAYAANRAAGLGRDIVPSQLVAALSVPGVYQVTLTAPAATNALSANKWAHCTGIQITLAGTTNG